VIDSNVLWHYVANCIPYPPPHTHAHTHA